MRKLTHLKKLLEGPDGLHKAEEAYFRMFFEEKKDFPYPKSNSPFKSSLLDLLRDTLRAVQPGLEKRVNDRLNIQEEASMNFFCGFGRDAVEFLAFFYFSDLDIGAVTVHQSGQNFQYLPLRLKGMPTGQVPTFRPVDLFGQNGIYNQVNPPKPPPKAGTMLKKIEKLRQSTISAESLPEPFNLFLELTENHPDYFSEGEPEEGDYIVSLIGKSMAVLAGQDGALLLDHYSAISLPQHSLVHGACSYKGHLVVFYFFKDLRKGVMAVSGWKGQTMFMRITATSLGKPDGRDDEPWGRTERLNMN